LYGVTTVAWEPKMSVLTGLAMFVVMGLFILLILIADEEDDK